MFTITEIGTVAYELDPVDYTEPTSGNCSAVVIFLHGTGFTGPLFKKFIWFVIGDELKFPHVRIIYPTAPITPYSPFYGLRLFTWYDVTSFSPNGTENYRQIHSVAENLYKIIKDQINEGIPLERMIIAGYSRGGAMALHMGYSFLKGVAGVAAISSFIPISSQIFLSLQVKGEKPILLQQHGISDNVLKVEYAEQTFDILVRSGVQGTFKKYSDVGHELTRKELRGIYEFINDLLPEL